MLQVRSVRATLFDANCYVLWEDSKKLALVVDPGPGTAVQVQRILRDDELKLGAILLTHGHGDHVWEAQELSEAAGPVAVYYTQPDRFFLDDPAGALGIDLTPYGVTEWQRPETLREVEDLDFEPVSGLFIRVIPAPGHSPGSALFLVGAEGLSGPLALSGDVVFAGTVGRTDLPGGDETEMRQSLRTLSNSLDPATTLLPGHGPQTTWAKELRSNPYVVRACKIG